MSGLALLFALPSAATVGVPPRVADAPPIGEVLSYKFRSSPRNANGATELADFRGRPLLIEFWGTR
jgi:hypothetical protein